jgi:hypothetical protein
MDREEFYNSLDILQDFLPVNYRSLTEKETIENSSAGVRVYSEKDDSHIPVYESYIKMISRIIELPEHE